MLKFIYAEEGGQDIELTSNSDYVSFEDMCDLFANFVASRGFDKADLAYEFEDEAFKDVSLDDLCDEWRTKAKERLQSEEHHRMYGDSSIKSVENVIEATIDALVVSDKYYVRRLKDD